MISQSAMSSRDSLRCASLGRLFVNPVKKHGHIHSLMKGIQDLRDGPGIVPAVWAPRSMRIGVR